MKIKHIFVLLIVAILCCITVYAEAGTEVKGEISTDTIWTKSQSPYYITGNTLISENAELTIEAGVEIIFTGEYYIQSKGIVSAIGTETNKIVFSTNAEYGSYAIQLRSDENAFEYCEFLNKTGYSDNKCIEIYSQNNSISNCTIQSYNGIYFTEGANNNLISNCQIKDNTYGIKIYGGKNNIISDTNITSTNKEIGILIGSYDYFIKDLIIQNCKISGFNKGISYPMDANFSSTYATVKECTIENCYYAIDLPVARVTEDVKNISLPIEYCNMTNCTYNVYVHNSHSSYDNSSVIFNIVNNFWGTTVIEEMDEKINDYYDNFNLPKVIYQPYLLTQYSEFLYTISNEEVTIIGCNSEDSVEIPAEIDGYPVNAIGSGAFLGKNCLTSIKIPESVTVIGESAFSGCTSLSDIVIPDSITTIGSYAFERCDNLSNVYITDVESWCNIDFGTFTSNPMHMGASLYLNDLPIIHLSIPDTISNIKPRSFAGCGSIQTINIPNGVVSIGSDAFGNCEKLTSIELPNSVLQIGDWAFSGCANLVNVTLSNNLTTIGKEAFYSCISLKNITIPNTVTAIGLGAFNTCTSLESINIPDGVTTIKDGTFHGCKNLSNIMFSDNLRNIENRAFSYCENLKNVNLPEGITNIGNFAFHHCGSLENIDIPSSVLEIGNSAFADCSILTNITIPNKIKRIESGTFSRCFNLASVSVPEKLSYIGSSAFAFCRNLTDILIPDTVTSIGYGAFQGCSNLSKVNLPEGINKIESDTFSYCSALKEVKIPEGVTVIDFSAFSGCSNLRSIEIPSSVKSIGDYAFMGCVSLTDITLPHKMTSLGVSAFSSCLSLTDVIIPDGITTIANDLFFACKGLTSITIPNGVTSIGYEAFMSCSNLSEITIPNTLINIGDKAFYECNVLSTVNYKGTEETFDEISIGDYNDKFINANIKYLPATKTTVSDDKNTFTIAPISVDKGNLIILALYKGNMFVKLYSAVYDGDIVPFTVTEDYDIAKIMVWESFTTLRPITEVEVVE